MTPDLYAAWLTAGNNLQPAIGWLAANWINLAIAVSIGVFAWWSIRRSIRAARRDSDRVAAWLTVCTGDRPEPPEHGRDAGLLLVCIAAYGDCKDLDRLRDAIDQHRTGESNG